MQKLLNAKASPEVELKDESVANKMSNNPLCVAVGKNNGQIVSYLLKAKADMVRCIQVTWSF